MTPARIAPYHGSINGASTVDDPVPAAEGDRQPRKFGTGKELKIVLDPDWDKAIETQEELEMFLHPGP